jgi:hypothetical protein
LKKRCTDDGSPPPTAETCPETVTKAVEVPTIGCELKSYRSYVGSSIGSAEASFDTRKEARIRSGTNIVKIFLLKAEKKAIKLIKFIQIT